LGWVTDADLKVGEIAGSSCSRIPKHKLFAKDAKCLDVKTKNAWKGLKQNPGLQKPICFAKEAEEIVSAKLLPSQAAGVLKVQNQESDSLFFYLHS
jgi:hypothetical protein